MLTKIDPKKVHARQQEYVNRIKSEGFDFGLTVATSFVKSIRDLGYRSTGTALNDLIDNAAEAGAEHIHIAFGYPDGSKKPGAIATLDDGIGMVPDMVRAAVVWGGTDRHNSRDLFGRYGYGLPSSSVSQGRRFTVYSRTADGPFYAVTLDLDEIAEGRYIENGRVTVPVPAPADLPTFASDYAKKEFPGGTDALRTVVVWDKLDRISYRQSDKLENHLLETFGTTYRNLLRSMSLVVNGKAVAPVDPLFITEGARFYDLDDDRAVADDPITFEVRDQDSRESLGLVRVRFSLMPPTFARLDKRKKDSNKSNQNKRFPILKEHNGVIVLRQGRQIDVVTKGAPIVFVNYDRNIGIEVDFPPTLDEEFGVTTHKQQITISDRMWQLLTDHGVWATVEQLRKRYREMIAEENQKYDEPGVGDGARPSEMAMADASKLDPTPPPSDRRSKQAENGRQSAIDELVGMGVPHPDAERVFESVVQERPFRAELERVPEGPFYRVELRGGQVVLYINKAHRFFTDIYASVPGAEGVQVRQALEVLLFVLGKCEIEATEDRQLFYMSERQEWSKRLHNALSTLERVLGDGIPDEPPAEETAEPEPAEAVAS